MSRRFGVEIETNVVPIRHLAARLSQALGEHVAACPHGTADRGAWVVKPDASCGLEACSPVLCGPAGLDAVRAVTSALRDFPTDSSCSVHVHVEVADLTAGQVANVIRWWVKCEMVFLDAFPPGRRNNRYCQVIGLTDWLRTDGTHTDQELIYGLGGHKYWTLNTYHYSHNRQPTLEFRLMDCTGCTDPDRAAGWIGTVLHFVNMTAGRPAADLLWLDPPAVLALAGTGWLAAALKTSEPLPAVPALAPYARNPARPIHNEETL